MASLVVAVFALGFRVHAGYVVLIPGAIAALVFLYERRRIRQTPVDASRPGIVPGDE